MHPFEAILSVSTNDIEWCLNAEGPLAWDEFWLNPRRLRGSDFLMRWSQGVWSEERLSEAVNATKQYFALPYGPSSTAPDDDVRAFELYFERLESAGLGRMKRPDLLIFKKQHQAEVTAFVEGVGGVGELPFTLEENLTPLLKLALIAVECENSLWKARQMPAYGKPLTPQKRLGGLAGLNKSAVLPTVIVKDEDRAPLNDWQKQNGVPIHVWHVFYDEAYGLSLNRAEELIASGLIEPAVQIFQAPGGATTRKAIYKFYYHYAYPLGQAQSEPILVADSIVDKNGHILPYVKFQGGSMILRDEALQVLHEVSKK
jgi:hypothetical protein